MMDLNLMSRFFQAADEGDVHSPEADLIASRWVEDTAVVEHKRTSANFVFTVRVGFGRYFLRFNHSSERSVEQLQAELDFLKHLADRGIAVTLPVASRSNRLIETVPTGLGDFHAVLFESLSGEMPVLDDMSQANLQRWGQALACVHTASEGFGMSGHRSTWQDHIQMIRHHFPATEEAAFDELTYIEEHLGQLPLEQRTFGLIHFDFELDNLLWDQKRVGICDFDDCAYYWYEADIAFALRDLFDDRVANIDLTSNRMRAFMQGYRSERELTPEALMRLPLFARLHNLIMCAKLYRSLGSGPDCPEPKWTTSLREKCRRKIGSFNNQFRQEPIRDWLGKQSAKMVEGSP
jgi:Ser/Thr protein kinase RdoA (MazF antagonist)